MTLRVELVVPDGEVWSGHARMVIAKTLDGDMGVLTGHPPVFGILAEGSVLRILGPQDPSEPAGADSSAGEVRAALSSGFLAVADDRVSILAREAELGSRVDAAAVQAGLDAMDEARPGPGEPETLEVRYSRALLRAAGEKS